MQGTHTHSFFFYIRVITLLTDCDNKSSQKDFHYKIQDEFLLLYSNKQSPPYNNIIHQTNSKQIVFSRHFNFPPNLTAVTSQ